MSIRSGSSGYSRKIHDFAHQHYEIGHEKTVEKKPLRTRIVRIDLPLDLYEKFETQANEVEMPVNIFILTLLRRLSDVK